MITAVDTNVLLDIFLPDKKFAPESGRLLKLAYNEGALLICDIVYAELVPQFKKRPLRGFYRSYFPGLKFLGY